ncbi:unnamed protein product, partial [Gulo gulo]
MLLRAHSCNVRLRGAPGSKPPVHGESPHGPACEPVPSRAEPGHLCQGPTTAAAWYQPAAGGAGPGRPPPAAAPPPLPPTPVPGALPGEGQRSADLLPEGPEPQGLCVGQRVDFEVPGAASSEPSQQGHLLRHPDGGPHRRRHLVGGLCLLL